MQFSRALIFSILAIATANAASIAPRSGDLQAASGLETRNAQDVVFKRASFNAQVDEVANDADSSLKTSLAKLEKLNPNTVTVEDLKPIFKEISSNMQTAANKFNAIEKKAKSSSKQGRQDLNKAVNQLVTDLNKTLVTVEPLLRHLTKNLKLGTVQDLVDLLTPGLAALVGGIESLLITLAPGLATIVDPLLVVVEGLTAALGLNLNLPALPSN